VDAVHIVIGLKVGKLSREVTTVPKQYVVEKLSPRGADEAFNKGMRKWNVRHRFDFIDFQNPKVAFPAMKFE
jgi:hypothetical protein